ncbi:acyltransferase [Gordonia alkaliphila]|uniref:acyltransferase n=1 Tax=Gordonia alkaliphila TaxID=1053547 RepID=UPI001FF54E38|nr:acyltransferase [Gordonia alkaliphila]MCK0438076.1 acyltransferase [Gordonia alkaliphila]
MESKVAYLKQKGRKGVLRIGQQGYNLLITYFPSHHVRLNWLRFWGASIGAGSAVMRGCTVLDIRSLTIGDSVSIGSRCLLDARGGLTIEDAVVIASDVHLIGAYHVIDSDDFESVEKPIHIGDHAWIASRATVLCGVTIGRGAVVGACSLVRQDVGELEIVAGVPAKHRGMRRSNLTYDPKYRPVLY